jgi:hypothetical protein
LRPACRACLRPRACPFSATRFWQRISEASATILGSSSPSSAAVEYVKVCSLYGAGYYYIPGTDQCGNANPVGFRVQTESGMLTNQFTSTSTRYGVSGYAGGAGSSSFGYDAYAGGDPNAPVPMTPPPDPSDPSYDPDYAALYATNGGFWPRTGPNGWPSSRFPYSSFNNLNATAVGSGARAGAGAFGQDNATAVGQGASANGLNATTVGQGASANVTGGTAIGQGSSVTAAGAVAIGQGSVADVANTVSVGSVGHERRIMNVAAGVMGTDAVNLDQMNAAISAATGNTASGTDVSSAGGATASGDDAFAGGNGAVASGGSSTAIGSGAQATQMGGTAIGAGATASGDPTTAVGFNSNAAGTDANAFGAFATATGNNSTALGANSSASAANSVALGNGSVASRGAQTGYAAYGLSAPQTSAGEVSVGTPGAERQITHVAAGPPSRRTAPHSSAISTRRCGGSRSTSRRRWRSNPSSPRVRRSKSTGSCGSPAISRPIPGRSISRSPIRRSGRHGAFSALRSRRRNPSRHRRRLSPRPGFGAPPAFD